MRKALNFSIHSLQEKVEQQPLMWQDAAKLFRYRPLIPVDKFCFVVNAGAVRQAHDLQKALPRLYNSTSNLKYSVQYYSSTEYLIDK